jgi:ribosome-associated protein
MSLGDLNVRTRRRLRRHAWLLTAWSVGLGVATSWVLLHGFGLRAAGAALRHRRDRHVFARPRLRRADLARPFQPQRARGTGAVRPRRARRQRGAGREKRSRERRGERARDSFDLADGFGFVADLLSLDEAAALLLVPALLCLVFGGLLLAGVVPALLMDGLAGLLAEVAVQFVFGALIARRIMRPKAHDAAFMTIVAKTWLIGVLLVAASLGAGWLLGRQPRRRDRRRPVPMSTAPPPVVDEAEVEISAVRAQGAGGRTSTRCRARSTCASTSPPRRCPRRSRRGCSPCSDRRLSEDGIVVIKAQRHRSQDLNRRDALERLNALVARAAEVPLVRKPDPADARVEAAPARGQGRARRDQGGAGQGRRLKTGRAGP